VTGAQSVNAVALADAASAKSREGFVTPPLRDR